MHDKRSCGALASDTVLPEDGQRPGLIENNRINGIMKRIMIVLVVALTSADALAYYMPEQGRWLSRDPIEENGGRNLHGFVANDPVDKWDRLGLEVGLCYYDDNGVWTCKSPLEGCCNGQRYLYATHCCCKGKIVARAVTETGIEKNMWSGIVPVPGRGWPYHVWLTWPGGSIDINAVIDMYIVSSPAAGPALYFTPAPTKEPVKLSLCKYDFDKLINCLNRKAEAMNGKQIIGKLCDVFVNEILEDCKSESKGCTVK
jgi:hypothetical protein